MLTIITVALAVAGAGVAAMWPEPRGLPPGGFGPAKTPKHGRRLVYVCHPYSADPADRRRVSAICRGLVAKGHLPIAPRLYLPAFVDESTDRALALELCLGLLERCDDVWVYAGRGVSDGMQQEINHVRAVGLPVLFVED